MWTSCLCDLELEKKSGVKPKNGFDSEDVLARLPSMFLVLKELIDSYVRWYYQCFSDAPTEP